MKNIAIFASGNGSNFEAIVIAMEQGILQVKISLLVCDKPGAGVIARAKARGIETLVFSPKAYFSKGEYEQDILLQLRVRGVEFLVLAGYMRLVGETLLEAYPKRIVNIHPSLLPAFPGKGAIAQAYESGVTETGISVHYVDEGMDTGPVIARERVAITAEDTLETLTKKMHQVEHVLYVRTLKELFEGEG